MSRTIGRTDEDGFFGFEATFDTQNSSDMEEMQDILNDEEMNATVEDHGPKFVKVFYRPDRLTEYGF